jgi:hypothetical protein
MIETQNIEYEAQFSLDRILPHMQEILKPQRKPRWHRSFLGGSRCMLMCKVIGTI